MQYGGMGEVTYRSGMSVCTGFWAGSRCSTKRCSAQSATSCRLRTGLRVLQEAFAKVSEHASPVQQQFKQVLVQGEAASEAAGGDGGVRCGRLVLQTSVLIHSRFD
jgi:hypothetical protein